MTARILIFPIVTLIVAVLLLTLIAIAEVALWGPLGMN
jgi:hypothetical protein